MPDIDTSSYPRPQQGQNPLDIAGKLQGLESNRIGIDQQKLQLANQHFQIVNQSLSSLLYKPDLTADDIVGESQKLVNLGLMTPDHFSQFVSAIPGKAQLQKDPQALQKYLTVTRNQALTTMDAMNWYATGGRGGGFVDTGNTIQPYGLREGAAVATSPPIAKNLPVTQPEFKPNSGKTGVVGSPNLSPSSLPSAGFSGEAPQPQQAPMIGGAIPGATSVPTTTVRKPTASAQAPARLPIQQSQAQPDQPASVTDRINAATGERGLGPPPMFEEGKAQYLADQNNAKSKLEGLRSAIVALSKMDDLRSGPGTPTYNQAVAFLKTWGVIPTQTPNDPTANYQEVNKYLHQFLKGRGTRSDADLSAAEQSSPNLGLQINPALIDLTRNAVAQDRVDAGMPGAFKGVQFDKYGAHRTNYASTQDLRAAQIDLMKPAERKALMDEMRTKQNTPEGQRFTNTLKNLRSQQIVNPPTQ
jgi:hypothetical protein